MFAKAGCCTSVVTESGIGSILVAMPSEELRLHEANQRTANWQRWGPYLSERQWATVREDYSAHGECWKYFPHDLARSRAYRWGEDGLLGICDRECRLNFSLALWNGKDPILKERLFGLTGLEGNHGEDVKEVYFYLDYVSDTHSYLKGETTYKYPQAEFPYDRLVAENRRRGPGSIRSSEDHDGHECLRRRPVFRRLCKSNHAKSQHRRRHPDPNCTIANRSEPDAAAMLHLLPTLWFRNYLVVGLFGHEGCEIRSRRIDVMIADGGLRGHHAIAGTIYRFFAEPAHPAERSRLGCCSRRTKPTSLAEVFKFPKRQAIKSFKGCVSNDFVIRRQQADAVQQASRQGRKRPRTHHADNVPAGKEVTRATASFRRTIKNSKAEPFGPEFDRRSLPSASPKPDEIL